MGKAPLREFLRQADCSTLSDDITAFTDVKGNVDGTPFTASLRLDKAPARKLKASLAGDSFDLTSLETGQTGADALSSRERKGSLAGRACAANDGSGRRSHELRFGRCRCLRRKHSNKLHRSKNVAIQLKFNSELLTVTKLSAETADGLCFARRGRCAAAGRGARQFRWPP